MTMLGSDRDEPKAKPQRRVVLEFSPSFYEELEARGLEDDLGVDGAIRQACRQYVDGPSYFD